jgi:oligo-alginate lyase
MQIKKVMTHILVALVLLTHQVVLAQTHPSLILTPEGVEKMRSALGKVPLFDATLAKVKAEVDAEIALGIHTPLPTDFSGGYTHQRHKLNFQMAAKAGALYQILQQPQYAAYVKNMLLQYAVLYPTLPLHPQTRSYARGKLFWQCLNDSNWLVYMSQAYDAIYTTLTPHEHTILENDLFRPFADFISIGNPQFYNRIHNHSTWGNAAVGMIALVMNDETLLQRALYGIADDGLVAGLKDNDGGFIKVAGQKAGFLANLDEPFSPDGYFTEGPYYQRYAMYPFLIFALAMHNTRPELQVLEYKDKVLLKAVRALLNLSDADGEFFPLNDGQKGMSYYSQELVSAVDIAYYYGERDPQLLSIVAKQGAVLLDQSGLAAAIGVRDGLAKPFIKQSINLTDGPDGKQGGVAVLRSAEADLTLVFKYTAQGSSHGHYDKLSYSLYRQGAEVLQDYGLVRFVNISAKGGGNYLPENSSWAKQTIAHNTLVQNQNSHFQGDYATASQYHSDLHFYRANEPAVQVVSAKEQHAYPGTSLQRTLAMIQTSEHDQPMVLDMFKVNSASKNQYDLPFHYMGQVINANFAYDTPQSLTALGKANGYQHLYLEGQGKAVAPSSQFSWLNAGSYFTLTMATQATDQILLTRLGANDPDFNLRRDAGLILRRQDSDNTVFASLVEPHGSYDPVTELSLQASSNIAELSVVYDDHKYTAVSIKPINRPAMLFIVANQHVSNAQAHQLTIEGKPYRWQGPYFFTQR